jgi:hypothetical protein
MDYYDERDLLHQFCVVVVVIMDLSLNRKLNLVIPVDIRDGITAYVHSTPISREVFESYYQVIARTFNGIYQGGLGPLSGPRVAKLELRRIATEMGLWDGANGVNSGLIGEIHRLTNVIKPRVTDRGGGDLSSVKTGWAIEPFEDVLRQKYFDDDDISEIENAIVFFIVASAMHKRSELGPMFEGLSKLWGAQTVSSNCTEYSASLPTSIETENIGEKRKRSSIPV